MGGRKFRLGRVRKNAERKKTLELVVSVPRDVLEVQVCHGLKLSLWSEDCSSEPIAQCCQLTISLPISAYADRPINSLESLVTRLSSMRSVSLPWVITSNVPLILCMMATIDGQSYIDVCLTIDVALQWTVTVRQKKLHSCNNTSLFHLPRSIKAIEDVSCLMRFFGSVKICVGNPDVSLIDQWKKSLHCSSGGTVGFLDTNHPLGKCTLRHKQCQMVISSYGRNTRCSECSAYRLTLLILRSRARSHSSKHINYTA